MLIPETEEEEEEDADRAEGEEEAEEDEEMEEDIEEERIRTESRISPVSIAEEKGTRSPNAEPPGNQEAIGTETGGTRTTEGTRNPLR